MSTANVMVERIFDADITLVWKAITEKELMKQRYIKVKEFKTVDGLNLSFGLVRKAASHGNICAR